MSKSTASIHVIPRQSNLFMYKSYRCENVWKENEGGTDNNPKPDIDNINGQITIQNQIFIISMHIASLVKRPRYLLKLSSGNENIGMSRADNSVKVWLNLPIGDSKPDLFNVNAYTCLVKIPCYLLKLSSGNENMGVSQADNSVIMWWNLPISNFKPDLLNVNAYSKFG